MWWNKKKSKEQPKSDSIESSTNESVETSAIGFKEQIVLKLKGRGKDEILFFGWLCAVRALPFIGFRGNLNFWEKEERKKHLYAIFRALDANYYFQIADDAWSATRYAMTAATRDAWTAAAHDARTAADAARVAAAAAANYSIAAAAAARAAADAADAPAAGDAAAYVAADAAAYAADAADAARANRNIRTVIMGDIKAIQKKTIVFDNQLKLYRKIWDNFQKALVDEGCAYWGRLYQDIFENGFKLDEEALKRRMNVPKEIQEQGAEAVAIYLEELVKQGAKHLNEARIIILGEKGAGKTCLARRLKNPDAEMTTDEESTAGVDTTLWKLEEDEMNIRIWDFAGHTVTHAVHQFFLSERCLYILVYDGRTEERNRMEYWLNQMKNYGDKSKVYILINKRDPHPPEIPINSLKDKYPVIDCYTFSIKEDRDKLENFRKIVAGYIKNNVSWSKQEIPVSYYNVKKELEELFTGNENEEYIDIAKFKIIAKRNRVDDPDKLLEHLHALGICLNYKNLVDFDTLVLNPEWISQGIYKIINWVHQQKKYSISINDLSTVYKEEKARYPVGKHSFLFELMKRYELAYEIEKENCLIIPRLLIEDRPDVLPDFPVGETLMLRYIADYPFLPDTISRFIVRHNEQIIQDGSNSLAWRYGVVLEYEKKTIAMVRETEKNKLEVSVRGKDKTKYLSILRETLNNIFDSYKSEKPELQYRIERFGKIPDEIEEKNPIWLSDRKIYNHYVKKRPYYDDYSDKDIPLGPVVKIYHINAEKLILGDQGHFNDNSIHNTFNFYDCNIDLQGNLNDLASLLKRKGATEEADVLEDAAKALTEAENLKTPEEVKKKGIANKLKRIAEDLENENTTLHKAVKTINSAVKVAQDIGNIYNGFAQWVGLPQVPKLFLKKE